MRITVINGTESHCPALELKEKFLRPLTGKAEIKEWYLPKDMPNFCCGCKTCVTENEGKCRDARYFMPIWKSIEAADLVVFVTPVYAGHAPAAVINLLDHLEWAWITHRPRPALFGKRAFVITAGDGAGNKAAAKDITDSLNQWGIGDVKRFGKQKLADAEVALIEIAEKYLRTDYSVPAKTPRFLKKRFNACARDRQRAEASAGDASVDSEYWRANGWTGKSRPW